MPFLGAGGNTTNLHTTEYHRVAKGVIQNAADCQRAYQADKQIIKNGLIFIFAAAFKFLQFLTS